MNRSLTAVTLALAFAAAMVGCSHDRRTENGTVSAKATDARNSSCPICGMNSDSRYGISQDGKSAACCSQACRDTFNKSSSADKSAMMSRAWGTSTINNNSNTQQYASMENQYCPMSGKKADGKHSVVMDGHRTDFCSEACVDQYRAMSPDHRAEVRAMAK